MLDWQIVAWSLNRARRAIATSAAQGHRGNHDLLQRDFEKLNLAAAGPADFDLRLTEVLACGYGFVQFWRGLIYVLADHEVPVLRTAIRGAAGGTTRRRD